MISLGTLFLAILAYLMGSICAAIPVSKLFNLPNPTLNGSKNPGATNIYRLGGWLPASITLAIDALKGALPVFLAISLDCTPIEQGIVGMFAIGGHMLPVFYKFQGGKGVATTLGAGLMLAWPTTLALTFIWISLFSLFKTSSIASIAAAITAPFLSYILSPEDTLIFLIISLLIVVRHRTNIIKLINKTEHKTKRGLD